ncbi:uncharacterized protein LOC111362208 [Spodoptera litura]|uniref:Uncharacterized protein LOC111362208 n=1 Tax=Spodoptera litura TaxID=69820 RepID=A0A9J7ETN3_SPOLT|nr:uncharacterized protein LOC111362208 [Spodoptera litura]
MPKQSRKSRSRRRNHSPRSRKRAASSCDSHSSLRSLKSHTKRISNRYDSDNYVLIEQMQRITERLAALEEQRRSLPSRLRESSTDVPMRTSSRPQSMAASVAERRRLVAEVGGSAASAVLSSPPTPRCPVSAVTDHDASVTDRIVDAIRSINTTQTQATGKLDSGMRGPYRVVKALPHGRYELQLLAGSYGKVTQAAAEFMIPWRGEWTPETCAIFFEGMLTITVLYDMLTSCLCHTYCI